MSTLDIKVEPLEGVEKGVVVHLEGALDQPTRDTFLNRLKSVLAEGNIRCALDMEKVTYANSTAIGDLVIQFDQFRDAGGELVLLNPQHRVLVIIEMVGVNSVLPIFNTLDEARQHLSKPREREPAKKAGPPEGGEPAPPVSFPVRSECATCGVLLEFAQTGRYRCPHCGAVYAVDAAGQAAPGRARMNPPVEMTIPCDPRTIHAFQQFVAALPDWSGYNDVERARLENAIGEIGNVIHQKAYDGKSNTTFQVLLLYRNKELAIRIADHGRTLSRAAFPVTADYMTEFEHRARPARGNYLKMAKRGI